jgi:hypothetical protein
MDKTLANWLHQTVLELGTAISHWTTVSNWLRRLQICTEYINETIWIHVAYIPCWKSCANNDVWSNNCSNWEYFTLPLNNVKISLL